MHVRRSMRNTEVQQQRQVNQVWQLTHRQPVHAQAVSDFLLLYDSSPFFFVSELMDLLLTGEDQSQADQPNNLAEGHPM